MVGGTAAGLVDATTGEGIHEAAATGASPPPRLRASARKARSAPAVRTRDDEARVLRRVCATAQKLMTFLERAPARFDVLFGQLDARRDSPSCCSTTATTSRRPVAVSVRAGGAFLAAGREGGDAPRQGREDLHHRRRTVLARRNDPPLLAPREVRRRPISVNFPPTSNSATSSTTACFGLIDAIEKYDDGRGVKFETYAITRIHGAILDACVRSTGCPAPCVSARASRPRLTSTRSRTRPRAHDQRDRGANGDR